MALNNLGLGFVFTARDLASAKMARLERRFSSLDDRVSAGTARMSSAFRQLGVGLAVFTAGAAVVAGSFALANAAGQFEQGIAAVGAVTRATTDQLRLLREAAINAGIETQFSPTEAIEGLTSLATAGQTAEQATRTLIPALDLAAGSLGQLGVAQAAESVVGTLNAYGFSADQAASVTDRLLRITQLTNFQTRDFESGLAKAAAAGSVFGQELNDVLITMGLLRNRNIDASSSSTAFREAVRRLASDSRAQQAILGTGVQVFDQQTGSMRSVVDVMVDFADATRGMTDEERNRRVATAFGARGLLAFNAVLNASFTTMRDGREVTLQGADAIAALRREMSDARGTAQGFRDQLLDTFEGQKTLLRGTLQTFAVVLGEPFAAVFKPIVGALVAALNAVLRAFQAIPAPIKKLFAGLVVGAGAFLTLVGGVIAAKAAIALLAIGFKALGITLGGVLATLLPAILILAVLGAVVTGFVVAFRENLGGVGDFVHRTWARVRLFFRGLVQLFEQGGFSGAVREELDRAENQGLKRFLISVFQIVHRIGQIWQGFKDGFTRTIEEARPVFEDLVDAFSVLQEEIAGLFGEFAGGDERAEAGAPLDLGDRIIAFTFEDAERKADQVSIQLDNFDLSLFDREDIAGGAVLEVSWGYPGNMAPPRRVVVRKLKGFTTLTLEGRATSVLMDREVKTRAFENMSRADVARAVAEEHGYEGTLVDVEDTGEVLEVINQTGETDARFLRRLASREELEFYVDDGGFHFHERRQRAAPTHVFTWYADPGRGDVLSVHVESDLGRRAGRVTVRGRDPLTRSTIEQTVNNDTAERETLAEVIEVVDPDTGATTLETRNATATVAPTSAPTSERAGREAQARFRRSERGTVKLSMRVVGDPTLHAKSIVEVRGISGLLSGKYYVTDVKHVVSSSGYLCELKLTRDGSGRRARRLAQEQRGERNQSGASAGGTMTEVEVVDPDTGATHIEYRREGQRVGAEDPEAQMSVPVGATATGGA